MKKVTVMNPARPFWKVVPGCCLLVALAMPVRADEDPRIARDIEFARVGETRLALDLYRPSQTEDGPLIVWVHAFLNII